LTPGVYNVDRTIKVKRADTVVLGLGFATLTPANGTVPMTVADVPGVDIAGLIFDAGPANSPTLLQIGTQHASNGAARDNNGWSNPADPTGLQDVRAPVQERLFNGEEARADARTSRRIVAAMRERETLTIIGTSARGGRFRHHYLLAGAPSAIDAAAIAAMR